MGMNKFILVVEDSPTQARQIEETLRNAGYSAGLALSGKEALERLEKERPALVLADIVMPEMDGFELCKAIKSRDDLRDIPVILLTQLSDPKEVVRGMECGADDFVVKPYNEQALLARIEGMLSGEGAQDGAAAARIIVAEDSPTQAEQLRFLLEKRGYSVRVAANGQECLDMARAEVPTLIISDVLMPVMDGYELAYKVKHDEALSRVPVILITSLMDRKEIVQRASVVADAFFTKPFDERYLVSKIESLLNVVRKEDDETASIEISFAGETFTIKSGRRQILTFLLSTYENAVEKNRELLSIQRELQHLNENLEERVSKRTRQLQESEANYRRLLETSVDAIVVAGRDNTVFFMNRSAEALFGASYEEMAGKPFFILLNGLGTKDVEVLRDGERAYAEARTVATTWGEEPAILAAFRETTGRKLMEEELRASEESFRALSDNANDGIAIVALSDDCRVIYANKRLAEVLGFSPGELLHRGFHELTGRPTGCPSLKEALEEKQYCQKEAVLKSKDGLPVQVEMAASRTLWHGQRAAIIMVRDIADRKKREEELLKASKLESLGTLAGGIAHDFNNLLTAIIGNLSVARLASRDEKVTKPLIDADNASHRAKDLTKQLLTFAKGGAPVTRPADLSSTIRESASFSVRGSHIKCELDIPANLPAVEADEGQISQVIHNLVINADQAMPSGGLIRISAAAKRLETDGQAGEYLNIRVSDTGIGIDAEHAAKIFDPYFTTKKEGSGLGLATVYSVVKNHGGFVEVESALGKGTTFSIYLPVTDRPVEKREAGAEEAIMRGSGRVLVMDDEEIVREAAGAILEELGYDVVFASHGAEAIEVYGSAMATGRPFDAVIMDLTVPAGMGGREAVKKLLEMDPEASVIVSSGYSNDDIMSNYGKFGFRAVIAKPYRLAELSRTVKSVVDARQRS